MVAEEKKSNNEDHHTEKMFPVDVDSLAERALKILSRSNHTDVSGCRDFDQFHQVFIGIGGTPGSGKSHIAEAIRDRINEISPNCAASGKDEVVVIPMDGYHLQRKELKQLADDQTVIESDQFGEDNDEVESHKLTYEQLLARRGAAFTYCPSKFIRDLKRAKETGEGSFPVYSRSKHDPVSDGVHIRKHHKIVFVEGLYLLCTDDPDWKELDDILDDKWYIEVSLEETKRRLVERHLQSWDDQKTATYGGSGPKAAAKKAETNDMINARCIKRHSKTHADLIIGNEEVTAKLRGGNYRRGEEIVRDSALYA